MAAVASGDNQRIFAFLALIIESGDASLAETHGVRQAALHLADADAAATGNTHVDRGTVAAVLIAEIADGPQAALDLIDKRVAASDGTWEFFFCPVYKVLKNSNQKHTHTKKKKKKNTKKKKHDHIPH
jgi:hypothetical protein